MKSIFSRPNYRHRLTEQTIKEIKTTLSKKVNPLEDDSQEHDECVNCGSKNITIHKDKDECHECGYVYE